MKVLILSTYEHTGGAAIAAQRLLHALQKNGVEATMLCRRNLSWWKGKPQSWTSIIERGVIWAYFKLLPSGRSGGGSLWSTDIALLGQDITRTKEYKEADVVHLHWVNQGFISLKAIEGFIQDGKKVVWTMHDAWNAMGAYHLKIQQQDDWLERRTWARKQRLYASRKIQFVTCSEWLRGEALSSELMADQSVVAIPNPLDTNIFKPSSITHHPIKATLPNWGGAGGEATRKRVLFVAADVNNKMKGIQYLNEAAKQLDGVEILALGRDIPYISDVHEMAELYASVDAFVLPSLSENLPNTIMEAMACGTPCVGFNVGGIPEEIDHKVNGYVARYKDAADLAEGIRYVLAEENHERLSHECVAKVARCYSEKSVVEQYIKVYNQ